MCIEINISHQQVHFPLMIVFVEMIYCKGQRIYYGLLNTLS